VAQEAIAESKVSNLQGAFHPSRVLIPESLVPGKPHDFGLKGNALLGF
jgi:hypothetical protein